MKNAPLLLVFALLCAACLASCSSTAPTAVDLDRYYKQAEANAQRQIDLLDAQLARGEITQEERDMSAAGFRADIGKQANIIAWTRHDLSESQKRYMGVPTGDTAYNVGTPMRGTGDSFYRPYGDASNNASNSGVVNMSPSMMKGYTPGAVAGQARNGGFGGIGGY